MTDQDVRVSAGVLVDANQFDIVGPIHISYSRSSIAGVPLLSYQDAELDLNFQGEEIVCIPTPVGDLVIVTLENLADAFVRTFTLIVPSVRVSPGGSADLATIGFETTDRSGAFVPPPGPEGVLQTYRVHQLRGSAQQVNF